MSVYARTALRHSVLALILLSVFCIQILVFPFPFEYEIPLVFAIFVATVNAVSCWLCVLDSARFGDPLYMKIVDIILGLFVTECFTWLLHDIGTPFTKLLVVLVSLIQVGIILYCIVVIGWTGFTSMARAAYRMQLQREFHWFYSLYFVAIALLVAFQTVVQQGSLMWLCGSLLCICVALVDLTSAYGSHDSGPRHAWKGLAITSTVILLVTTGFVVATQIDPNIVGLLELFTEAIAGCLILTAVLAYKRPDLVPRRLLFG